MNNKKLEAEIIARRNSLVSRYEKSAQYRAYNKEALEDMNPDQRKSVIKSMQGYERKEDAYKIVIKFLMATKDKKFIEFARILQQMKQRDNTFNNTSVSIDSKAVEIGKKRYVSVTTAKEYKQLKSRKIKLDRQASKAVKKYKETRKFVSNGGLLRLKESIIEFVNGNEDYIESRVSSNQFSALDLLYRNPELSFVKNSNPGKIR